MADKDEKLKESATELQEEMKQIQSSLQGTQRALQEYITAQRQINQATKAFKSPLLSSIVTLFTQDNINKQKIAVEKAVLNAKKREQSLIEKQNKLATTAAPKSKTVSVAGKTNNEVSQGTSDTSILGNILEEVTIIRKVVEGRVTFEKKAGMYGGYRDTRTGQLVKEENVRGGLDSTVKELTEQIEDEAVEVENIVPENNNLAKVIEEKADDIAKLRIQRLADAFENLAEVLNNLVVPIRQMQQNFGIAASQASDLKLGNFVQSFKSYTSSLLSLGQTAGVSSAEIENAQKAFQEEFGTIITSGAAKDIAREAKETGVSVEELAKARRTFMTSSLGDLGRARAMQTRMVEEFKKQGLSPKEAIKAMALNSELLARNGNRFAASFARAAAEAKKIGVDIKKVDQVGDNIISGFEGFLESQAELGAMGFSLDSMKLAQIAETGDTGALFNELRSQLASTGKDITKLRRSEQLALSEAFGLSMEDIQRLAGKGGTGEAETDQQKTNRFLGQLVNLGESAAKVFGVMAALLGIIAANTALNKIKAMLPGNMGTGVLSRVGSALKAPGVGGIVAGLAGGVSGFMTAKEQGKGTYEAAGAGTIQGGFAAAGTIAGAFAGPLGMAIGGFLGNTLGKKVNEWFPDIATIIGDQFKSLVEFAQPLITSLKDLWAGMKEFGSSLSALAPVAKFIGFILGASLVGAFEVLGVILKPIIFLLTGLVEAIKYVMGGWSSLISLFSTGDDVISKPGYGDRTLVTPTQTIALNNNDNIIAYADDMVSTAVNDGVQMLSYGELGRKAESQASPVINLDLGRVEAKLDDVIRAIGSMKVEMDGTSVGKILGRTESRASTYGPTKTLRRSGVI